MKQKKIGTTLYVFDTTAYQITEDTDATVIKIQEECIPAYAKLNQTLVSKFEPINYKLYCVQKPEWADYYDDLEIIIAPTTNGTVTVSPASADMGEEVTIITIPDFEYKLNTLTVMCGDVEVQVTDNKFTMPVESVVVTATFIAQTYAERYFTIESLENNNNISLNPKSVEKFYTSKNNDSWQEHSSSDTTVIELMQGDKLRVKSIGSAFNNSPSITPHNVISGNKQFKAYGNTMSLIYGDDFIRKTSFIEASTNNLTGLFYTAPLTDASNLILPATTLANYCYSNMFEGCTSLTTVPELPATTLANGCYYSMFNGCTSLTTAPELPATTLTDSCYAKMLKNCTSLTTAPELPATTLTDSCYLDMFQSCSSLNYIKCLATDKHAKDCCSRWVSGVAATGTFVKDVSMSSWTSGASGIPSGWTVEDYTPSV